MKRIFFKRYLKIALVLFLLKETSKIEFDLRNIVLFNFDHSLQFSLIKSVISHNLDLQRYGRVVADNMSSCLDFTLIFRQHFDVTVKTFLSHVSALIILSLVENFSIYILIKWKHILLHYLFDQFLSSVSPNVIESENVYQRKKQKNINLNEEFDNMHVFLSLTLHQITSFKSNFRNTPFYCSTPYLFYCFAINDIRLKIYVTTITQTERDKRERMLFLKGDLS